MTSSPEVSLDNPPALVADAIDLSAVDFDGNGKVDTDELVDVRNMILESIKPEVIINVEALEEYPE